MSTKFVIKVPLNTAIVVFEDDLFSLIDLKREIEELKFYISPIYDLYPKNTCIINFDEQGNMSQERVDELVKLIQKYTTSFELVFS